MNLHKLTLSVVHIFLFAFCVWAQNTFEATYKRGLVFYEADKYAEAVEEFKKATQLNPDSPDAFFYLGHAYRVTEKPAEAILAYQQALKLKPNWADALNGLGVANGMLGKPAEAYANFKAAIALNKNNAKFYYNLSVACADLGKPQEAVVALKEAIRLNPKDADSFFNLGASYLELNQLQEAEAAFVEALALNQSDAQTRYQLARVYMKSGNKGLAQVHYLALRKQSPELAAQFEREFLAPPKPKPTSFLEKRVTFALLEKWQVQKQEDSKQIGRTQIFLPYPQTDNTPHSANAAIIANLVPASVTVKEVGDKIYRHQYEGMTVVNDLPDGKNWRTVLWSARSQGVTYLSLSRFGVVNGVAVEFTVAFPLLENGDPKWIERTVAEFNEVCQALKIDGTNSTEIKIMLDKLPGLPK